MCDRCFKFLCISSAKKVTIKEQSKAPDPVTGVHVAGCVVQTEDDVGKRVHLKRKRLQEMELDLQEAIIKRKIAYEEMMIATFQKCTNEKKC